MAPSDPASPAKDGQAIESASASGWQRTRTNLTYLALGSSAAVAPASLRTRTFLTTTRYVIRYAIRRLLRYAKYAAAGALVAAVGGLLGTLGAPLTFFAAPGILMGSALGLGMGVIKFGWRHRGNFFRTDTFAAMKARAQSGHDGAADEQADADGIELQRRKEREWREKRQDVWMRV